MAQRAVVVTGASTGIGRATVVELVSAGYQVFATVRRETDADSLRQQFPEIVTPVIMDLLDEDSVRAAGEMINSAGPLFGLVNNAGAALPGPLETIPIDVFRRQIEINLTAQLLVRPDAWRLRCRQAWASRTQLLAARRTCAVQDQGFADRAWRDRNTDLEPRPGCGGRTAIARLRGQRPLCRSDRSGSHNVKTAGGVRTRSLSAGQDHPRRAAGQKSSSAPGGRPGGQSDSSDGPAAAIPHPLSAHQCEATLSTGQLQVTPVACTGQ